MSKLELLMGTTVLPVLRMLSHGQCDLQMGSECQKHIYAESVCREWVYWNVHSSSCVGVSPNTIYSLYQAQHPCRVVPMQALHVQ